jgi:hypothetical protein
MVSLETGYTGVFETMFRNRLRKFPLVRHVDSCSFSSHHLPRRGNMFTNASSLVRFSCEGVLCTRTGLEYAQSSVNTHLLNAGTRPSRAYRCSSGFLWSHSYTFLC